MLRRVISGGQTGTDIAALRAAKRAGLQTGGYMAKGWATLRGPKPEYRSLYDMEEIGGGYPTRTRWNVQNSDATLILANNFQSPGTKLTIETAEKEGKELSRVMVFTDSRPPWPPPSKLHQWIHRFDTLNVAGNSEAWLESIVEKYLDELFGVPF